MSAAGKSACWGFALTMAAACVLATPARASSTSYKSGLQDAGEYVAIAIPVAMAGVSVYKDDWNGLFELGAVTGLTVGTAYGLKQFVHERRPDGTDWESFPSEQEAIAFSGAAYAWDRYGWEYGVPAYAAAGFVGYARVDTKRHHWWDVASSAAIGWVYSRLITREYHPPSNFQTGAYATPDGGFVSVSYRF
jgi:membrane-associated phospholipid phosphatase